MSLAKFLRQVDWGRFAVYIAFAAFIFVLMLLRYGRIV